MSASPPSALLDAAKLTVGFSTVYCCAMMYQVVTKQRLIRSKKKKGETFERYNHPELRDADRLVGNLLEWSPCFLGCVWPLAAADGLDGRCLCAAWGYVGLRGLYACLVVRHGVSGSGLNRPLWAATLPGYLCLMFLWKRSLQILFL